VRCDMLQCVAVRLQAHSQSRESASMCCSVWKCVAACCSLLQRVAVQLRAHSESRAYVAVCYGVFECIAVCCSVLQCVRSLDYQERGVDNGLGGVGTLPVERVGCSTLQHVAVCCSAISGTLSVERVRCSVLRCVAVCCSVLQCVAACCSLLQCDCGHTLSRESVLQCATMCLSASHCAAACCSVFFRSPSSEREIQMKSEREQASRMKSAKERLT